MKRFITMSIMTPMKPEHMSKKHSSFKSERLSICHMDYSEDQEYNVFYLMHGGWSNETTTLGTSDKPSPFKHVVDNAIADGMFEPLIIVCPTYNNESTEDSGNYTLAFYTLTAGYHNELVNDLIPVVEGTYSTYAESTSPEDIKASRNHRAFGGFSMGSVTTWYTSIIPDKTVEITNYMKNHAEAGETIFYDIYMEEEKAADPAKENTGLFFFKGNPGEKFAVCNAGGGFAYVGAMRDSFPHAGAVIMQYTGHSDYTENDPPPMCAQEKMTALLTGVPWSNE